MKNEVTVVPLVAREAPVDRVEAAGFFLGHSCVLHAAIGHLCGRALRLFGAVNVFHDVRCRTISVRQHICAGPPGGDITFTLFGRRIGPGGWYLTYPGGKLAYQVLF